MDARTTFSAGARGERDPGKFPSKENSIFLKWVGSTAN